jgi:hypothetical protein
VEVDDAGIVVLFARRVVVVAVTGLVVLVAVTAREVVGEISTVVDVVAIGARVVDVVVVIGACTHDGSVNVFVSNVTAPFCARSWPSTSTPVVAVIDVSAKREPAKVEFVPRVAELPTCQNTWHAFAPLIKVMTLAELVIRVESV